MKNEELIHKTSPTTARLVLLFVHILYQQAEQRDGEDAQQGGEQGAVGGQLLAVVVDLGEIQQDAGTRRTGQDHDTAFEHRIKGQGEHQQVAEERENDQFSG